MITRSGRVIGLTSSFFLSTSIVVVATSLLLLLHIIIAVAVVVVVDAADSQQEYDLTDYNPVQSVKKLDTIVNSTHTSDKLGGNPTAGVFTYTDDWTDPSNPTEYAFICTYTKPSRLYKLDLARNKIVLVTKKVDVKNYLGSWKEEEAYFSAMYPGSGKFVYFASKLTTARVNKWNLETMKNMGAQSFSLAEEYKLATNPTFVVQTCTLVSSRYAACGSTRGRKYKVLIVEHKEPAKVWVVDTVGGNFVPQDSTTESACCGMKTVAGDYSDNHLQTSVSWGTFAIFGTAATSTSENCFVKWLVKADTASRSKATACKSGEGDYVSSVMIGTNLAAFGMAEGGKWTKFDVNLMSNVGSFSGGGSSASSLTFARGSIAQLQNQVLMFGSTNGKLVVTHITNGKSGVISGNNGGAEYRAIFAWDRFCWAASLSSPPTLTRFQIIREPTTTTTTTTSTTTSSTTTTTTSSTTTSTTVLTTTTTPTTLTTSTTTSTTKLTTEKPASTTTTTAPTTIYTTTATPPPLTTTTTTTTTPDTTTPLISSTTAENSNNNSNLNAGGGDQSAAAVNITSRFVPVPGAEDTSAQETDQATSNALGAVAAIGGVPAAAMSAGRALMLPGIVGCVARNGRGERWIDALLAFPMTGFPGVGFGSTLEGSYARAGITSMLLLFVVFALIAIAWVYFKHRASFNRETIELWVLRALVVAFAQTAAPIGEDLGMIAFLSPGDSVLAFTVLIALLACSGYCAYLIQDACRCDTVAVSSKEDPGSILTCIPSDVVVREKAPSSNSSSSSFPSASADGKERRGGGTSKKRALLKKNDVAAGRRGRTRRDDFDDDDDDEELFSSEESDETSSGSVARDGLETFSSSRLANFVRGFWGRTFLIGYYTWHSRRPHPAWAVVHRYHGKKLQLFDSSSGDGQDMNDERNGNLGGGGGGGSKQHHKQFHHRHNHMSPLDDDDDLLLFSESPPKNNNNNNKSFRQRMRDKLCPHTFVVLYLGTLICAFCVGVAKAFPSTHCRGLLVFVAILNTLTFLYDIFLAPMKIVPVRSFINDFVDFVTAVVSILMAFWLSTEEDARSRPELVKIVFILTKCGVYFGIGGNMLCVIATRSVMYFGKIQVAPEEKYREVLVETSGKDEDDDEEHHRMKNSHRGDVDFWDDGDGDSTKKNKAASSSAGSLKKSRELKVASSSPPPSSSRSGGNKQKSGDKKVVDSDEIAAALLDSPPATTKKAKTSSSSKSKKSVDASSSSSPTNINKFNMDMSMDDDAADAIALSPPPHSNSNSHHHRSGNNKKKSAAASASASPLAESLLLSQSPPPSPRGSTAAAAASVPTSPQKNSTTVTTGGSTPLPSPTNTSTNDNNSKRRTGNKISAQPHRQYWMSEMVRNEEEKRRHHQAAGKNNSETLTPEMLEAKRRVLEGRYRREQQQQQRTPQEVMSSLL